MPRHYSASFLFFWPNKKIDAQKNPYALVNGDVKTDAVNKGDILTVSLWREDREWSIPLTRADARMLAKRIYQCLEESK